MLIVPAAWLRTSEQVGLRDYESIVRVAYSANISVAM